MADAPFDKPDEEHVHFRDKPRNQPHDMHGAQLPCGPWLRVGTTNEKDDGTYWIDPNNEWLAVASAEADTDGKSALFVTPNNAWNKNAIEKSGFKLNTSPAPARVSEFENWRSVDIAEFLAEAEHIADIADRTTHVTDANLETWRKKSWVPITGARYTQPDGKPDIVAEVPVVSDPLLRGAFNTNQGVLTILDWDGKQYIADSNHELEDALITRGYRHTEKLLVPFANGEIFKPHPHAAQDHTSPLINKILQRREHDSRWVNRQQPTSGNGRSN